LHPVLYRSTAVSLIVETFCSPYNGFNQTALK
jgi:hypothetical protein